MDRTLIYTCANDKYTHFIPLLILTYALYNDNVDFEIGVNLNSLSEDEEMALDYLRKRFPDSEIKIKYNFFKVEGNNAIINDGRKCILNTVRFITEPEIKDKYTYICDIDIVCLKHNFYDYHIENMEKLGIKYSNMVRSDKLRMTGMHFTETDALYPLPSTKGINLLGNDEIALHEIIKKKGLKIDYQTKYRPIFGVHFSFNRPTVKGANGIVGWGADNYKEEWIKLTSTIEYKDIYPLFDSIIKEKIKMLEEYYKKGLS